LKVEKPTLQHWHCLMGRGTIVVRKKKNETTIHHLYYVVMLVLMHVKGDGGIDTRG